MSLYEQKRVLEYVDGANGRASKKELTIDIPGGRSKALPSNVDLNSKI
jgi:hypothetical protein